MSNVITFDHQFDATEMSCEQIRREARQRGWAGLRIDADEFRRVGRLIVRRMSRKEALGES